MVGPAAAWALTGCVCLTVDGWDPARVADVLDQRFGIATRAGLHCAPLAHRTLGTFPEGTVRVRPGWKTTPPDIEEVVRALGLDSPPPGGRRVRLYLTFGSTHGALRAESLLRSAAISCGIVPKPREIRGACGLAVRIDLDKAEAALV